METGRDEVAPQKFAECRLTKIQRLSGNGRFGLDPNRDFISH